jgi:hypothetical protein
VPLQTSTLAIAAGLIAAAGLLCGCSRSSRNLTAADTIAALRSSGLTPAVAYKVGQAEVIVGGAPALPPGVVPLPRAGALYVVRLSTASAAERTYKRGYSRAALTEQATEARKRPDLYSGLLPKGFPSGVKTERVCNLIVVSNNPSHRAILNHEFDHALGLLRAKCK